MAVFFRGRRGVVIALCAGLLLLSRGSDPMAQTPATGPAPVAPNFDLGSRWTSAKVGKLVFDTSVTPHWLNGDRFWYSYQTRDGRRFFAVDPLKKTKAPLFDHAKIAAQLTAVTREPYDAQHLPFSTIKFKNDTVFEFDVSVPRDAEIVTTKKKVGSEPVASGSSGNELDDEPQQGRGAAPAGAQRTPPRNKTLRFEYDLAAQTLTLDEEYAAPPARPRWAALSPDGQTVIFARNHNLYMMDAANFAKAQKSATDSSIAETQLTTDGEEYYSYARSRQQDQQIQEQQQQQQQDQQQDQQDQNQQDTTTA